MGVFKTVAKIFVVFFTVAVFLVLALVVLVKFRSGSEFSDFLRRLIIRSPLVVNVLNLNQPGDAVFVYLNSKEPKISVELKYLRKSDIEAEAGIWIKSMLNQTINKDVNINASYLDISEQDSFSNEDLNLIREKFVKRFNTAPTLYIFYLTRHKEMQSNLGITLHRDTIFIFKDAIDVLSSQSQTRKRLEQSTLMHEWGHLLRLPHFENSDCIMSPFVEVGGGFLYTGRDIPVEYCPETIQQLDLLKQ